MVVSGGICGSVSSVLTLKVTRSCSVRFGLIVMLIVLDNFFYYVLMIAFV